MHRAFVTGSSRRLGKEFAVALQRAGWDVCVHGRDEQQTLRTAIQLNCPGVVADLAARSGCHDAVLEARDALGGIDLLVCSASTFVRVARPPGSFRDLEPALDSVRMVFGCVTAALRAGGLRQLVTVSDRSVEEHWEGFTLHAAAKVAIERMTLGYSMESWAVPLRANCLRLPTVLPPDGATEETLARLREMSGGIGEPADATAALLTVIDEKYSGPCILRVLTESEAEADV